MTSITGQLTPALADRYQIERELGTGGMALVFLATDLKHHRKVALKVLRPELAAMIGAERFLKEIEVTANLQHPHILPLHDSGEAGSFLYYVMPFVEGETLRTKLEREKQLAIDEAIAITKGVASALDYAHRHGVIHRDIKPENILLHDGQPLVADFGIALAVSQASGTRLTETGLSVGTPQYMSPEQAMGDRQLDARSDIYSLGATLYEMLAGDPPYTGSTAQAIVAKVITEKAPPVTAHRDTVPPHVAAAVAKALAKLPADRFHSAAEFNQALANTTFTLPVTTAAPAASPYGHAAMRWNPVTVGATAIALAATVLALWFGTHRPAQLVTRFSLALPKGEALQAVEIGPRVVLSPDGSRLVYVGPGEGGGQFWVRDLGQLHATPVNGTEGGRNPFFSPDGKQLGFFAGASFTLKIASLAGGPPITLADTGISGGGGTWGPDGYIYFDAGPGLARMKASGGPREVVFALDTARAEAGIAWPEALPNGKGLILRLRHVGQDTREYDIVGVNLRTKERHTIVRGAFARYAEPGYLVYVTADGKTLAVPFDQDKLSITGTPTPLLEGLGVRAFGAADLTISNNGTLVYTTGSASGSGEAVWVNRDGAAHPVDPAWAGNFALLALAVAPTGRSLAVGMFQGTGSAQDIWVKQLDAGPLSRLTFEGSSNNRPAWTPDGRSVLYLSNVAGVSALYEKRADGSGQAQVRVRSDRELVEALESRDGRWFVVRTSSAAAGRGDILALRIGIDSAPRPLLATQFGEAFPTLSPDSRYIAYVSNESGQAEIYVRPFPDVGAARWQVSTAGGTEPIWSHGGREIFYRSNNGDLVAAQISTVPAFSVVKQQRLFSALPYLAGSGHQGYDVSPDDKRFIMVQSQATDQESDLILVQNWFTELKAKVAP